MKLGGFDPYAEDKQDAFFEQVKENNARRAEYAKRNSKTGKRERILMAAKSSQSRRGKVKVSLSAVKFLDEAE